MKKQESPGFSRGEQVNDPADRDDRCGTYAGVAVHKLMGEPVCDDCRAAAAAYAREWRARRKAEGRPVDTARQNARRRALVRLGHRHPAELEALIQDELRRTP